MKYSFNYHFILIFLLTISFISCKKDIKDIKDTSTSLQLIGKEDIATIPYYGINTLPVLLGNKLQNPYTIPNMKLAVINLSNNGINPPGGIKVRVTHKYIKFSPKTTSELMELKANANFVLYDYPLDYEIERSGNWYRDLLIRDEERPTFHYASVKVGYQYNSAIEYEVLEELYIPEEDEELIGQDHKQNLEYLDQLQEQAYFQTNENRVKTMQKYSWYTPAGNIKIYDTRLQQDIPLEGALMTAKRWFTTYTTFTDANGNFSMNDQFKRPCDYKLYFQHAGFVIGDNWLQQAKIGKDNIHGNWNYTIGPGYENMQGHMFRGAYRYFYQDIQNLKRPFRPSNKESWIVAKNSNKTWSGINYIILPLLKVARYNTSSVEYDSDEFFSTTCHEIAHTRHVITMNLGALQYSQVSSQIQESWAIGVEWLLTGLEYKSRGISNYGEWNYQPTDPPQYPNFRAFQYWNTTVHPDYTNLFINLIDNINESTLYANGPNDNVTNYTLSGIEENILKHSYGLSSLSQYLKSNKPSGVTDAQIDQLLISY